MKYPDLGETSINEDTDKVSSILLENVRIYIESIKEVMNAKNIKINILSKKRISIEFDAVPNIDSTLIQQFYTVIGITRYYGYIKNSDLPRFQGKVESLIKRLKKFKINKENNEG